MQHTSPEILQTMRNVPMHPITKKLQLLTAVGYIGLFILIPLWYIYLFPTKDISLTLSLAMFWLPLFFPLKGLIKGNPYTYAWANFVVMIYFMHGLTGIWLSPEERHLYIIEIFFATCMFIGATYYARYRGRELGLKLPKLKDQK
ncbi:DUF2069 domain-containing protein [Flocculibacter collagenilyticus]|uniref:DUF2069 domain-containing protein n=1 Tax=Flocculibacter collagenilyticus TaxID=2744479 RepID=UPI001F22172C|nr:DUF2069 domain-containing protein [Flocculibacter collagenilyticus]